VLPAQDDTVSSIGCGITVSSVAIIFTPFTGPGRPTEQSDQSYYESEEDRGRLRCDFAFVSFKTDVLNTSRCFVIGAGISVQAGIPDFRSPEGLFQTLKRDNPRESLASGKDLFDASVFNVSVC
jgi:hypothetical protein